ncbi:tRNA wybutosine-synthesizing protein 3 homolog isoform X1 [Sorex araneus]|uniref:tRNA wybutosine-synthesizing protein 3 homolog isoform X1 n=1 Tax=Sorex araneus TaxID=42254 RepID=UPI002433E9D0|nr:tRNA wybutosine-synthesizing protein 3 homolog isoform X1 [Sorex araneus]
MDRSAEFRRWKTQCLSKADLSRKGSLDDDVVGLVQLLNEQEQFFTTSSCSGRIVLLDGVRILYAGWSAAHRNPVLELGAAPQSSLSLTLRWMGTNGFEIQKQNCCWLLVSHKPCVKDDVIEALKKVNGDAILKFEPFVLHVQCQALQDAQILHSVAMDSGFRNSGITVGKKGKTMLAVRSTHGLEVPLSQKGKLMVSEEYIAFVLNIANQKMEENKKRIERFYTCLQNALEREASSNSHLKVKSKENNSLYTHKKKRKPEKACDKCVIEKNDNGLENDEDDAGLNVNIFPEDY